MFVNQDILFHDGTKQFCKYNEQQKTYSIILRANKGRVDAAMQQPAGSRTRRLPFTPFYRSEYSSQLCDVWIWGAATF